MLHQVSIMTLTVYNLLTLRRTLSLNYVFLGLILNLLVCNCLYLLLSPAAAPQIIHTRAELMFGQIDAAFRKVLID